ncbi:MAG: 50S ribosomal protein L6 [Rhodospirillales bacterium]|nr:50S ribosomal protein L6 [Rhodospirillales bacterium]
MSRVGKNPVSVPDGVEVTIDGAAVAVKGKLGSLRATIAPEVSAQVDNGQVSVTARGDDKRSRQMWGLTRSIINNMVVGVSQGFHKDLQIEGVGYRAAVEGKTLTLDLGYSHRIRYPIPDGIEIACERPTAIRVTGYDRQAVGQVAAEIRAFRKPEPYKGKGIRYVGEYVRRKEGKKK